ncbi:hypothetical protein [Isobaculum melis]|uniref:Tetratricopeptide repeat-containing protein n=1 Tax=Isobaculum melis TaxID=142588 RepID=A0A1H9R638_9LACT|nr:hypothetical protein [Isobaculum melis]SER68321.1 hypothetical protein SAMN04488559_10390 [Isobaculum melis]
MKRMEDKIVASYQKANKLGKAVGFYFVGFVFLLVLIGSFFWGTPFDTSLNVGTIYATSTKGWLNIPKTVLIIVPSLILSMTIMLKRYNKIAKQFDFVLLDQCDAVAFRQYMATGVTYGKNITKGFEKNLRNYYEAHYLIALMACGELQEAKTFLASHEASCKALIPTLRINIALEENNLTLFNQAYEDLLKNIQKPLFFSKDKKNLQQLYVAIHYMMHENYEAALDAFEKTVSRNESARVNKEMKKGICFFHLKRFEEATACFNDVVQHGNTLHAKKLAMDYLMK